MAKILSLGYAALLLVTALTAAACGNGNHGTPDATLGVIADAAPPDAVSAVCDPFKQTGCRTDEKCAWIRTAVGPTQATGALECVPAGTKQAGAACTFGPAGATGYDDCAAGLECLAAVDTDRATGTCRAICDTFTTACAAGTACATETSYFDNRGQFPGEGTGLCAPTCDPLTNKTTAGAADCGGTSDANGVATQSCIGLPKTVSVFTCAPTRNPTRTSDVSAYETKLSGAFVDSCAPGYVALLYKDTDAAMAQDEMSVICVAYCEPGPTSKEAPDNAAGKVGSAYTCPKKGAGGTHECRYWWLLESDSKPTSPYSNGLGYCFDYTRYKFDPTAKGAPATTQDPSCTTLSSTAHTYDPLITDDIVWGCGPITGHALTGAARAHVHAPVPLVVPARR